MISQRMSQIEFALGALLFAAIVILVFVASVMRYFDYPLIWSVDMAQLLFIWLCFVGATKAMRKVLKLIPELDAQPIESSCCGMAGQFGLESEHAEHARQMAEQGLYPALQAEPEAAVIANGFSCQQQILNGGYAKPLHIAEVLYAALAR